MTTLSTKERNRVLVTLVEFLNDKRTFTDADIHKAVRDSEEDIPYLATQQETSHYIRQLFSINSDAFRNYGSYPIPRSNNHLYFPAKRCVSVAG